jgi:hypothetical protein
MRRRGIAFLMFVATGAGCGKSDSDAIVAYSRENNSGTYMYFKEHVLDEADFAPNVQTLPGTAAVVNAVSDHTVASYAQRENVVAAVRQRCRRERQLALTILLGEERRARGHAPEDGYGPKGRTGAGVRQRERARGAPAAVPALEHALALESAQVIERGARGDLELVANLPDRRRHAVARRERPDEAKHFALPPCELSHGASSLRRYHTQRVLRLSTKKESPAERTRSAPRARTRGSR